MRPTTYAELDAVNQSLEMMHELQEELSMFTTLLSNMSDTSFGKPEDYAASVASAAREFAMRVEKRCGGKEYSEMEMSKSAGLIKSIGTSWAGIVSNNFQDFHKEIITAAAHKDFVRACMEKEWAMPELWYNHIPFAWGYTEGVFYDEGTGMLAAYGKFRTDDAVVEKGWRTLMAQNNLGMSHAAFDGNFQKSNDVEVTFYRTHEFTFLKQWKAANKLTSFRGGNE